MVTSFKKHTKILDVNIASAVSMQPKLLNFHVWISYTEQKILNLFHCSKLTHNKENPECIDPGQSVDDPVHLVDDI